MKILNRLTRLTYGTALAVWLCAFAATTCHGMQKWLYYPTNLSVDDNVNRLETVFRRAAKAGYTHVLIGDSKFGHLWEMQPHYFENIDRVKKLAKELRLEIVPTLFPIGYSNDLLWNEPNLIEGLPVKSARFVVKGGLAVPDSRASLKGGSFERPSDWDWKDDNMVVANGTVQVTEAAGQNARIVQKVRLLPFHVYHVEVEVKTESFQGVPEVKILAGDRSLNFADLKVKPTQEWTPHHVVFNSLIQTQVNLYLGAWGAGKGTLAFRNAKLSEAGLVNVIRRPGTPFTVKTLDGRLLAEGKDYAPAIDPLMGTRPWNGEYDVWHEPPALRTPLADGTVLLISWYHAITVGDGQAMVCLSEPKTTELLRKQARAMHEAWEAREYMMSFDEIRVMNWCEACQKRHLTPGQMLAQTARDCERTMHELNPSGHVCVWSDMFDPHHNAHDNYYLVNGNLSGSWEGLLPQTVVLQWNYDKRAQSLAWFSRRGNHQIIAGYYDHNPAEVKNWLQAAEQAPGVDGVMYTTWVNNYADLEKFASFLR